jgi:DNA-binding MarR family transcriptional regulator
MSDDRSSDRARTHSGLPDVDLVDTLIQLSFMVQAILNRIGESYDLSPTQVRLLGILRDRKPEMKALASYLELDKSSVSGLVGRAEKRKLVSRGGDSEDGRTVRVSLTPRVRQVTSELEERLAADLATLLSPLDAGARRQLSTILNRIMNDGLGRELQERSGLNAVRLSPRSSR